MACQPQRAWPWHARDFDSTSGYPGEGLRRQASPLAARHQVDLARTRALVPRTVARRALLARRFGSWLMQQLATTVEELAQLGGREVSRALAGYGQFLYDSGEPLGIYVDTINAVVDLDRSLRRQLQAAWDVADSWRALVPQRNHVPTPPVLSLAMISLALLWGWVDVAALIYLSFVAMLRPGELLAQRSPRHHPPRVCARRAAQDPPRRRATAARSFRRPGAHQLARSVAAPRPPRTAALGGFGHAVQGRAQRVGPVLRCVVARRRGHHPGEPPGRRSDVVFRVHGRSTPHAVAGSLAGRADIRDLCARGRRGHSSTQLGARLTRSHPAFRLVGRAVAGSLHFQA